METTILSSDLVDARVAPKGSLEHLSQQEIAKLLDSGQGGLYPLFRKCALAVLNSGSDIDDTRLIFEKYRDFDLRIVRQAWGIKLEIKNAPAAAFVDGVMIRGLKEHLFAVLRDVVFISNEIMESGRFDLTLHTSHFHSLFHGFYSDALREIVPSHFVPKLADRKRLKAGLGDRLRPCQERLDFRDQGVLIAQPEEVIAAGKLDIRRLRQPLRQLATSERVL